MAEQTPTGEILLRYATAIDNSQAWQIIGVSGSLPQDDFDFHTISRGPIPLLPPGAFEGIEDRVKVDLEPTESHTKIHIVRYVGDLVGLEMFVEFLRGPLDGGAEGRRNMIREFRSGNPLWALNLAL